MQSHVLPIFLKQIGWNFEVSWINSVVVPCVPPPLGADCLSGHLLDAGDSPTHDGTEIPGGQNLCQQLHSLQKLGRCSALSDLEKHYTCR